MDVKLLPVASPPAKTTQVTDDKKWKRSHEGLVGLVNIGNSCYMNAAIQALSNCPSFRGYFVECYHPMPTANSVHTSIGGGGGGSQRVADVMAVIFKKMWTSDKPPGHLSPRMISSAMRNKMFRTSLQQDSQEFLRCLLMQIHDETAVEVPSWVGVATKSRDQSHDTSTGTNSRDSMASSTSHDSEASAVTMADQNSLSLTVEASKGSSLLAKTSPLPRKKGLGRLSLKQKPTGSIQSLTQGSPTNNRRFTLRGSSSAKLRSGTKGSDESIGHGTLQLPSKEGSQISLDCQPTPEEDVGGGDMKGEGVRGEGGVVYEVDIVTRRATRYQDCHIFDQPHPVAVEMVTESKERNDHGEGGRRSGRRKSALSTEHHHSTSHTTPTPSPSPPQQQRQTQNKKRISQPKLCSIVTEVFEGVLESRVKCGSCKKVSVVHEPFQDLSLPIPGRKEMAKQRCEQETCENSTASSGSGRATTTTTSGIMHTVFSLMSHVKEMFSGPITNLHDCLDAFFGPSELKGGNQYYCSHCKKFQNSQKEMNITKLPEVLCIHLKRFRFDAYFSSKISRHIAFPMHDLDMGAYMKDTAKAGNSTYELCAIITHYGGAGGGHYVAFAKNSSHNSWFEFNDTHVRPVSPDTVINSEGYVLFYKRVAPSNSAALENIELSSLLLPRPGTRPDMPNPVVYLSRHWLHLLRTCSNPGPIFQYEFACEHGGVLPNRIEHARPLAMAVRRDIWDNYQERYGGGPMVLKLEVCSVCKTLLDNYTERRKKEKDDIYKLQSMGHGQTEKKDPFLLSQRWLSKWQSFIHCTTLGVGPPGPVDNSDLLQEVQNDSKSSPRFYLVKDSKGSSAYHKLSWLTWSYIIKTYGGGPVVTSSMSPPPLPLPPSHHRS